MGKKGKPWPDFWFFTRRRGVADTESPWGGSKSKMRNSAFNPAPIAEENPLSLRIFCVCTPARPDPLVYFNQGKKNSALSKIA
jgi:hypothetical protein